VKSAQGPQSAEASKDAAEECWILGAMFTSTHTFDVRVGEPYGRDDKEHWPVRLDDGEDAPTIVVYVTGTELVLVPPDATTWIQDKLLQWPTDNEDPRSPVQQLQAESPIQLHV
jgi:hypothetical protein